MPVDKLPSVAAGNDHGTLTLGELRELVAYADREFLDDTHIVRGHLIPFKFSDLGNTKGGCIQSLSIDTPERHTR